LKGFDSSHHCDLVLSFGDEKMNIYFAFLVLISRPTSLLALEKKRKLTTRKTSSHVYFLPVFVKSDRTGG
jgi:hypothetical protein